MKVERGKVKKGKGRSSYIVFGFLFSVKSKDGFRHAPQGHFVASLGRAGMTGWGKGKENVLRFMFYVTPESYYVITSLSRRGRRSYRFEIASLRLQ
jgi:hypothetical protein